MDYKAEPGGEERNSVETFVHAMRTERKYEIQLAAVQLFHQFLGSGKRDVHLYFRICLRKGSQCGYQQRAETVSGTDMQCSGFYPLQIAYNLLAAVSILYGLDGIGKESDSRLCRHNALANPVEQQHVQFVFQLLDLLGKGTLGNMQCPCCFRKILQLACLFKVFQLP